MFADGIHAHLLRLVMFDACGHGPHTEEAARVMALLRDFIAEP
jgi:pimeloyl-ACP methyl ester carboxylesterase